MRPIQFRPTVRRFILPHTSTSPPAWYSMRPVSRLFDCLCFHNSSAPSVSAHCSRRDGSIRWITLAVCFALGGFLLSSDSARLIAAESVKSFSSAAERDEWFEREVRPLLAEKCLSCHASSLDAPKGGFKIDRRDTILAGGDSGPAVEIDHPEKSLLLQAIRGEGLQMPPNKPLSRSEQSILERWVHSGLPWPERTSTSSATGPDWLKERASIHWAWQPVTHAQPPVPQDLTWSRESLDAFVLKKLEDAKLSPTSSATASVLLRRLAFDLTGLPPDPQDVLQWQATNADPSAPNSKPSTASDSSENATSKRILTQAAIDELYERKLEQYLASPEFGVTWGRHWLDLVRYSETLGHEFDYPVRHAFKYRDAVVDSINSDISYAVFVREHIAGDLCQEPRRHPISDTNQSLAMTGWWWMGEGLHAPVDVLVDEATRLDNQIDVFSKAFLGLTIACARCHDHKFDAISADDYASLVGVLQSSRRTYAPSDTHQKLVQHNQQLTLLVQEINQRSSQSLRDAADAASPWLKRLIAALAEEALTQNDNRKLPFQVGHPLFLLNLAVGVQNQPQTEVPKAFEKLRETMQKNSSAAREKWEAWQADSPLLASFANGMPEGWYVESADPSLTRMALTPPTLLAADSIAGLPSRSDAFTSHALGIRQQLALRSPTFELSHPKVALRIRGAIAQSSINVDNYFMIEFHGLLFGDMRKPIDQTTDWKWVVHAGNCNKYQNHPAFLSIDDDENSWFELSEVRLCHTAPPEEPHAWSTELLHSDPTKSLDALMRELEQRISFALKELSKSNANDANTPAPTDSKLSSAISFLRAACIESQRLKIPLPWMEDRELAKLIEQFETLQKRTPEPERILAIHEGTPRDTAKTIRGNPHKTGERVPRTNLQALGGELLEKLSSKTSSAQRPTSGRAELAELLTRPDHPLTARVLVNRVWFHLMGQGIIDTPDNFGVLGGAPSHPELLDHLVTGFVEHDWSIKWLVREICLSETYRLASIALPEHKTDDPNGRLLSHRQVKRLSAEQLRDAMVWLSGSLDNRTSGESVAIHLTSQMTGRGRPKDSGPLDSKGRRSLFIETRRNFLNPLLVVFDQPPPATTVGKRNQSNVPAQALSLLNDPLVHQMAQRWSEQVALSCNDHESRIALMFQQAYSRAPTADELRNCGALFQGLSPDSKESSEALRELAHVLMCAKEFQYLR